MDNKWYVIENLKDLGDSYIINCFIKSSPKDWDNNHSIFIFGADGTIEVRLDGYAIIPIEEYSALYTQSNPVNITPTEPKIDYLSITKEVIGEN